MRQKQIQARRQRNQELAKLDASHRCGTCKIRLGEHTFQRVGDPRKFCSENCLRFGDWRGDWLRGQVG